MRTIDEVLSIPVEVFTAADESVRDVIEAKLTERMSKYANTRMYYRNLETAAVGSTSEGRLIQIKVTGIGGHFDEIFDKWEPDIYDDLLKAGLDMDKAEEITEKVRTATTALYSELREFFDTDGWD